MPAEVISKEVIIDRRFRGPPQSGNGGYVCGLIANALNGPAEVTLKAPPPLDTPLTLVKTESGASLMHGDLELGVARTATLDLQAPPPVTLAQAEAASAHFSGFHTHIFPECFVCGPARAQGDGLRIFAGAEDGRGVAYAPWRPDSRDCDASGRVAPEIVWAALDCPSYFGLHSPNLPALLGRMTAVVLERPRAGETCVLAGWKLTEDGRKHVAGSALYAEDGCVLALAKAVWVELKGSG